jgi:hypothetical protein
VQLEWVNQVPQDVCWEKNGQKHFFNQDKCQQKLRKFVNLSELPMYDDCDYYKSARRRLELSEDQPKIYLTKEQDVFKLFPY